MKYLLVSAVLLVAFWWWRHNRDNHLNKPAPPPQPPRHTPPSPMVTCRHCGLHLPQPEAVTGVVGVYCSTNHRQLAEG